MSARELLKKEVEEGGEGMCVDGFEIEQIVEGGEREVTFSEKVLACGDEIGENDTPTVTDETRLTGGQKAKEKQK